MRIAIDITQVVYGTGVSTYTKNLVSKLLEIDHNNEHILFGGYLRRKNDLKAFTDSLKGNFKTKFVPIPPTVQNIMWNYLHLIKIERFVGKVDVFHSSDWSQPPSDAAKITTIHDLVPFKYPKLTDPSIYFAHKKRLERVFSEVDRIIVPSKTTKNDLVQLGFDEAKTCVIPEAADKAFKNINYTEVEKVRRKFGLGSKYLLSIGITQRKNTKRVIKAFENVKANLDYPLKLVLVGHPFVKLEIPRGVIVLGHVPTKYMPALYSGAEALVYPSLYEGFGLPILEAFSCKTPVITSNSGSMAEVAGNGAYLVDPTNLDDITNGILTVLKDREQYIKLGSNRNKLFNWREIATKTLEQYNNIIG